VTSASVRVNPSALAISRSDSEASKRSARSPAVAVSHRRRSNSRGSRSAQVAPRYAAPPSPRHRGPPHGRGSHGRGTAHRSADRRQRWPAGRRCLSSFPPRAGYPAPPRPGRPHLRRERSRRPRKAQAELCSRSSPGPVAGPSAPPHAGALCDSVARVALNAYNYAHVRITALAARHPRHPVTPDGSSLGLTPPTLIDASGNAAHPGSQCRR
jgi:hypothetical protein